jgi:PAS domain S-box-containing protein
MSDLSKKTKAELISEIKVLKATLSSLKKKPSLPKSAKKSHPDESKDLNFFKLAETSTSTILVYKKECVCYVNKSATKLTGYSKKEMLKMKFWDVVFPEDKEFVKQRGFSRLDGNKMENKYEFRIIVKNGEIRWIEFAADMIIFEGEPAALGIVLDVTERKKNELLLLKAHEDLDKVARKLKESKEIIEIEREQIEVTLRSIGDGLITTDSKGRIVILNKTAEEYTGWSEEEAFGRHIDEVFQVINEFTSERIPTPIEQVLNTGQIVELANHTLLISKKDGSKRIISDSAAPIHGKEGNILGVVLVFRDNTEDKRKEEKLSESENMYRTLFEGANDAIFTMDGNRFISCNKKTLEMFKCRAEDIIGAFPTNFSPPFQPDGRSSIESAQEKIDNAYKGYPQFFEWKHSQLDGTLFDAEVGLNRMELHGKVYLQAIVRNITERKKAEEVLTKSENLLRNILELSNISMAIVSFDGIIEYINKQAVKTFGYQHKEIPNMDSWWKLAYPEANYRSEVVEKWMGLVNKAIVEKCEIERGEYYTTCKDGSVKTMIIFGVIVDDKVFVMFEDITERKNAEEAVRLSEEQFRITFENAPIGMALSNKDGYFILVNKVFCSIFGYAKEEIINLPFTHFTHPEDIEESKSLVNKLLTGEENTFSIEKRYIHQDGHEIWAQTTVYLFRNPDGSPKYFIIQILDITENKQADEAIKQSEEQFRITFDNAPIGMCLTSMDGRFITVNDSLCKMMGYSKSELKNFPITKFTHPEDVDSTESILKQDFKEEHVTSNFEKRYIHKDGHVIWVSVSSSLFKDADGSPRYMIAHVLDVTERKKAIEELKKSDEQYRVIANNTKDIIVKYGIDGKISYISSACINTLGFKPFEMIGVSVFRFFHPDEIPRLRIYQENLLKEVAPNLVKHRLRKKDNTYIWCETSNQIIHNPEGKIKEVVAICRDISDVVKSEELAKEKEAAELANKAKSEFLANMSHEIRNPLNSIIGISNLMGRAELSKENKELVESIKISSNNLLNILNDILDFSKIEANKVEIVINEFEIKQIIENIYQSYKSITDNKKLDFSFKGTSKNRF